MENERVRRQNKAIGKINTKLLSQTCLNIASITYYSYTSCILFDLLCFSAVVANTDFFLSWLHIPDKPVLSRTCDPSQC